MESTLTATDYNFPGQTAIYKGKVRDVYNINNEKIVLIASDRISAFDAVLPKGIPFKGQILTAIAAKFLNETKDIVPNWLEATPDPNVAVGKFCKPFMVEMVIRGYLAGHAWREYKAGKRIICGVAMPDGMKQNDKFPEPIITPATKAEDGDHDEDISRENIIAEGIVSKEDYEKLESYTRALFQRGTEIAAKQDLILVDTKYEFGKADGTIYLIDEIHTPDSSRFFYAEGYQERQDKDEQQKQLSKEFVREWLIENGFQGLEGQTIPHIPDSFVNTVTERYTELYEKITGETFVKADNSDLVNRIKKNVTEYLS
jgi:phosphoribosylaminoimidazole-succinocarboxamide synthase